MNEKKSDDLPCCGGVETTERTGSVAVRSRRSAIGASHVGDCQCGETLWTNSRSGGTGSLLALAPVRNSLAAFRIEDVQDARECSRIKPAT